MVGKKHKPERAYGGVARVALKKKQTRTRKKWTDDENARLIAAVKLHGRQWTLVAKLLGRRNPQSVRKRAERYFRRLQREGKGHLIPSLWKMDGRSPKLRTEEAHQHQQEPTLTSASTSSDTIRTTGDHDGSPGGIEPAPPSPPFQEETSSGPVSLVCEGSAAAATAAPTVRTEDLVFEEAKRQLKENLTSLQTFLSQCISRQ